MKRLLGAPKKAFTAQEYNDHLNSVFNKNKDRVYKRNTWVLNFPKGMHPQDLILAYVDQGERNNSPNGLTWNDFDSISYLYESENSKNEKRFITALALVDGKSKVIKFKQK